MISSTRSRCVRRSLSISWMNRRGGNHARWPRSFLICSSVRSSYMAMKYSSWLMVFAHLSEPSLRRSEPRDFRFDAVLVGIVASIFSLANFARSHEDRTLSAPTGDPSFVPVLIRVKILEVSEVQFGIVHILIVVIELNGKRAMHRTFVITIARALILAQPGHLFAAFLAAFNLLRPFGWLA